MDWITFRNKTFDLGYFSINQVYAWHPGFDRNNFVRWTRTGSLVRLRQGLYTFPEYRGKPEFAAYFAGRIYNPSYISLHSALAFYGLIPEAGLSILGGPLWRTRLAGTEGGGREVPAIG